MERSERIQERNRTWTPPGSMSEKEFRRFSEFIQAEFGIKMPAGKKTMLESRLQKRLRALNMTQHKEYEDYLFSLKGMEIELPHLIDVVTTNKTDFFREPKHFEILYRDIVPKWHKGTTSRSSFSVWSAGCSTGEEPYTIAMVLEEYQSQQAEIEYSILGTDISNQVLETANRGVYREDRVKEVAPNIRKKYFLRSKDRSKQLVRIVPEIRSRVKFRQLNFMDDFEFREKMDVIFCRNVVIYFERPIQEALFRKFCDRLAPNGYLFIGHSETLGGMDLPLVQHAPTVYRKVG